MNEFVCRICGFLLEEKPWGEDGEAPTYDICPCCGVEFGNEDYCLDSIREYRIRWINNGCQWFRPRVDVLLSGTARNKWKIFQGVFITRFCWHHL